MKITREQEHYAVDGQRLWRVTHVINAVSKEWLPADETAMVRGQAVHQATRLYDEDGPKFEKDLAEPLPEEIRGDLHAWIRFRKEMDFTPRVIEQPISVPEMGYAGTPDRFGRLGSLNALVDIKRKARKTTALQTIAYAGGISGGPIVRIAVELRSDGSYNIVDYPVADWYRDWAAWLGMLSYFKWTQHQERKKGKHHE